MSEVNDAAAISRENAIKLARILQILEGENFAPGLVERTAIVEKAVFGEKGFPGLVARVDIIWRLHVWVLCSLSGIVGFALREAIRRLWNI